MTKAERKHIANAIHLLTILLDMDLDWVDQADPKIDLESAKEEVALDKKTIAGLQKILDKEEKQ